MLILTSLQHNPSNRRRKGNVRTCGGEVAFQQEYLSFPGGPVFDEGKPGKPHQVFVSRAGVSLRSVVGRHFRKKSTAEEKILCCPTVWGGGNCAFGDGRAKPESFRASSKYQIPRLPLVYIIATQARQATTASLILIFEFSDQYNFESGIWIRICVLSPAMINIIAWRITEALSSFTVFVTYKDLLSDAFSNVSYNDLPQDYTQFSRSHVFSLDNLLRRST